MDLLDQIDALIADRHLLKHPFYTKWQAGTLTRDELQDYAQQYYAFESTFPRFLSALHARTDRPDVRQSLLDNLWDEEHGEVNHAEMWLRFGEGIGADRESVRGAARNVGTRALLDTYWSSVTDGPIAAGIAALCSPDGRHLAVMPHPERTVLTWQWAWLPEQLKRSLAASPWLRMFQNAREWCEKGR